MIRPLEAGNVRREIDVVNLLQQLTVTGYLEPAGHRRIRQGFFRFLRREAIAVGHDVELEPRWEKTWRIGSQTFLIITQLRHRSGTQQNRRNTENNFV